MALIGDHVAGNYHYAKFGDGVPCDYTEFLTVEQRDLSVKLNHLEQKDYTLMDQVIVAFCHLAAVYETNPTGAYTKDLWENFKTILDEPDAQQIATKLMEFKKTLSHVYYTRTDTENRECIADLFARNQIKFNALNPRLIRPDSKEKTETKSKEPIVGIKRKGKEQIKEYLIKYLTERKAAEFYLVEDCIKVIINAMQDHLIEMGVTSDKQYDFINKHIDSLIKKEDISAIGEGKKRKIFLTGEVEKITKDITKDTISVPINLSIIPKVVDMAKNKLAEIEGLQLKYVLAYMPIADWIVNNITEDKQFQTKDVISGLNLYKVDQNPDGEFVSENKKHSIMVSTQPKVVKFASVGLIKKHVPKNQKKGDPTDFAKYSIDNQGIAYLKNIITMCKLMSEEDKKSVKKFKEAKNDDQ
jgi:hypothetical protein